MPEEKEKKSDGEQPKKLKPCCACPETKRVNFFSDFSFSIVDFLRLFQVRDECIILNGEEHCGTLIEAHKKCMRELGFDV